MPSSVDFSTDQALELWTITRKNYPFTDRLEVLQVRRDWPIVNQLFQRDKVTFSSGTQIIHDIMIDDSGTARMVLPNEKRTYDVGKVMVQINMPWRQINDYYVTNYQEISRNRAGSKLVDLLKVRRTATAYSLANKLEVRSRLTPTDSSDVRNAHGFQYFIVPITTAQVSSTTSGHQGANPVYQDGSDIGSCAGIDTSDGGVGERYRNYNDVWSNSTANITAVDVKKMLRMLKSIKFSAPITARDVYEGTYDNFRMYCGMDMWLSFTERAQQNNDNLGADIGRFAGETRIWGNPLTTWDELDDDTSYPLYAVNLDAFFPFVMEGDFFRETGPMNDVEQYDTFITNIDMQFNFLCTNRRKQGVISYVA